MPHAGSALVWKCWVSIRRCRPAMTRTVSADFLARGRIRKLRRLYHDNPRPPSANKLRGLGRSLSDQRASASRWPHLWNAGIRSSTRLNFSAHTLKLFNERRNALEHISFFGQILRVEGAHFWQDRVQLRTVLARIFSLD